jgi:hypothetical protein
MLYPDTQPVLSNTAGGEDRAGRWAGSGPRERPLQGQSCWGRGRGTILQQGVSNVLLCKEEGKGEITRETVRS